MDVKTLLDNLHEEVSCSVCMCKYTDPKMLPCLHSFCLQCLNGIQRSSASPDKFACPECRQEFRVPGNGNLSALPTNLRINSLLDVLAIKECNTTGVKCGNCDKKSDHSCYCFQCLAVWCDDCISLHNGIRANKEHHALALKDFQDRDFENILKGAAFYGKPGHEKKEMEFFCKSCEVPICYSCIATLHEGHPKVLLDEAANERKLHVMAFIETQKKRVLQKKDKIGKMQGNCLNIQAKVDSVKREVQTFVDNMIAAMEVKKREIFDDVEKKAKESLERLQRQQCEVENEVKLIETAIESTEILLKRSTNAEIVKTNIFQEGVFSDGEQVDCDLEERQQFVFLENETLMEKANSEGIGSFRSFLSKTNAQQSSAEGNGIRKATVGLEAHIAVTTRTADREQCYEERDYVTVEIRNRQGHDCTTKVQIQDNKDGTYKISYFAKETGTCEASVKVNEQHVRGSPFEVQVRPRQFEPVLSFGQKGSSIGRLNEPWGVAVNGQNEIAVTDRKNHRVQVFGSDGSYLRSFGRKGDQEGEFNEPTGIAFHNDNIIVADRNNHRVQILSAQGEFLRQFGGRGKLDHHLKLPLGVSVDCEGNIIVADPQNKLIKIFSSNGQFFRKIGEDGSLNFPFHCIRRDNYLIVSDGDGQPIKLFDWEGHFLYYFADKGRGDGEGEFNPRCLSVDKTGHLIVGNLSDSRVQVFEMSGKSITKFGRYGSEKGEFCAPLSSAVLSDGKIVVSDYYNNCIQIFE